MVFIRPTILRSAEESARLTRQRYGYIREQQLKGNPDVEPSIDTLVRDYMGAVPPGSLEIPVVPTDGAVVVAPTTDSPVTVTPPPGGAVVVPAPGTSVVIPLTPKTSTTIVRPVGIPASKVGK